MRDQRIRQAARAKSEHEATESLSVPQDVPLTGGRIGRKVLLGVLSRGHEIPFGGRPACGRYEKFFATNCEGCGRLPISVHSTGGG